MNGRRAGTSLRRPGSWSSPDAAQLSHDLAPAHAGFHWAKSGRPIEQDSGAELQLGLRQHGALNPVVDPAYYSSVLSGPSVRQTDSARCGTTTDP